MNNIDKIRAKLCNAQIDAMLILSDCNRFYASSFPSTAGALVVTKYGAEFFTDSRYIEAASAAIKGAKVSQVAQGGYTDSINRVISEAGIKVLGIEEDRMTFAEYTKYSEKLNAKLVPAEKTVSELRASKSDEELKIMIEAQRIAERALNDVLGIISTDITEKELAAELVYRMLKFGGEDVSFDPIIVSAEKSSMPHGVPGDVKIKKGFLTIDYGVKYRGYCSDTTRTFCIGAPTEEMKKVYDTVLAAQLAGIEAAHAGVLGCDIDKAARDVIEKAGYGKYFGHSFGHSLGIEIHEAPNASPFCKMPMPEGAVISAEPGIYIPGEFGVRIEDVLYLTHDGNRNITNLPKNLIIL